MKELRNQCSHRSLDVHSICIYILYTVYCICMYMYMYMYMYICICICICIGICIRICIGICIYGIYIYTHAYAKNTKTHPLQHQCFIAQNKQSYEAP